MGPSTPGTSVIRQVEGRRHWGDEPIAIEIATAADTDFVLITWEDPEDQELEIRNGVKRGLLFEWRLRRRIRRTEREARALLRIRAELEVEEDDG